MSRCEVCHERLRSDAQECPVCGEPRVGGGIPGGGVLVGGLPAVLAPSTEQGSEETPGEPATPDGAGSSSAERPDPGPTGRKRLRPGVLAAAVALVVAAVATLYLVGRDDGTRDPAAYGIVRLSSDPGVRSQVT